MQSNATSNNPCTGFTNNDSGDDGGDGGGGMHDGTNVDVVEYGGVARRMRRRSVVLFYWRSRASGRGA
jgi:hypothetical protein